MAAPFISISSDVSVESVRSSFPRVILIGSISVEVSVAPEVGAVAVGLPVGVLELDTHSSSKVDPSESSPPHVSVAPMVSPFLCLDDSESDTEMPKRHVSPTTSTPEIPTTPILPAPSAIDIPIGRLYRTHPGGPCRELTARKSVRPLSSHHLALRFVHRSLARTPQRSEAFRRWRSAPLSTPYPPTTSESSLGSSFERSLDSSLPSSRPSRKRCRSPTALAPSPTHVSRLIAPTPANLLPPRKRFRDSYSSEDSGEEHMEVDTADAEADADVGISERVVAYHEDDVGMRVKIIASDVREDDEEFKTEASVADTREITIDPLAIGDSSEPSRGGIPNIEDTIYDIVHYMSEVCIDRITEIETTQRQLETSQMVASGERASLCNISQFQLNRVD
ncbi:hypothetical protein Tco_1323782 [Tanacetum coccineum]